jgi:hypothetical protein
MTIVMDTCALRMAGAGGFDEFQAERTLAMCTSALLNISKILHIQPLVRYTDRLSRTAFRELTEKLQRSELPAGELGVWERLSRIRNGYEPLLAAMADYFVIELPAWVLPPRVERAIPRVQMPMSGT